jgi:hypothetical protein
MKFLEYLFCILILLAGWSCTDKFEIEDTDYIPRTELGQKLVKDCSTVARIYADTTFVLALGVEQTDLHFQKDDGDVMHIYLTRVDLNRPGVSLEVGMPFDADATSNFQLQTLSEMAVFADRPQHRIAALVNADFWDVSNGDIRGPIHRNGKILKDTFIFSEKLPQQALSFFAITNDGRALIRDAADYIALAPTLKEVTGSGVVVLRNGLLSGLNYAGTDPRTVIGYTPDNIVYMLVVDGRQQLWSYYGMTYEELGRIMQSLGCSWAVNFDGGGSTQLVIRHPFADFFEVHNRPSDGSERAVVNAWMAVVDEP